MNATEIIVLISLRKLRERLMQKLLSEKTSHYIDVSLNGSAVEQGREVQNPKTGSSVLRN